MGRTLVVAPLANEEYSQSEISTLVNILDAELLLGTDANSRTLIEKLNSEKWNIIWFVAHGDEYGIQLHDGEIDSGALASFIRNAEPQLVVLNTCESIGVALDLSNEISADFICTLNETPDRQAFFTGRQLATNISNGYSFHQAYRRSRSSQDRNYVYLPGFDLMPPRGTSEDISGSNLADIEQEIVRLRTIIYGDKQWNQPGLIHVTGELQKSCKQFRLMLTGLTIVVAIVLTTIVVLYLASVIP